ncbi:MAG: hypothetical protein R3F46_00165 [bacterium]
MIPSLIKADIADKKKIKVIGKVKSKTVLEPDVRIARLLIQDLSELDISDKDAVLMIVRAYLEQIEADGDMLDNLVQSHTGKILEDLTSQFQDAFDEETDRVQGET